MLAESQGQLSVNFMEALRIIRDKDAKVDAIIRDRDEKVLELDEKIRERDENIA